jgi:uncharacterized protein YcnI
MRRLRSALLLVALLPAVAHAHAVVEPRTSVPRTYQRYVLRVPNEFDDVPTIRVEIRFPAEIRVISFAEVEGWQLQVMRDSSKRVTGAVWTGSLPPERFVEFPFMAVNPERETSLIWPAYQTYASGERVDWVGPEDSDRPASVTHVRSPDEETSRWVLPLAAIAAVISLVSLVAAAGLRRRRA